jgi:hypothetical protein
VEPNIMNRDWNRRVALTVGAIVFSAVTSMAAAQEPILQPVPVAQSGPQRPLVPLKVQIVVNRTAGEKKVSSLPYVLWVTANDRQATSLRMGVEVPVTSNPGAALPTYNYRPVGTNIDCQATSTESGFNLNITLSDTSVQFDAPGGPSSERAAAGNVKDAPSFRSFTSKFSILLKDGQSAQYTSATDPVSGETLKVDVTLNVLK